jgi:hypothetical protein
VCLNHNAVAQLEMTTALLILFLLSTLVASESGAWCDETLSMIGLFDLRHALGGVALLSLRSGHVGNRRLAREVDGGAWPTCMDLVLVA